MISLAMFGKPPLALFPIKEGFYNLSKKNELNLNEIKFKIYKFNNRPKPTKKERIKIISCFSEFGCETLGCMYCLPRVIRQYPGQYIIAMGWYGREYLYRHLVDEFWEIDEEYMWLRDYTRAFHHISKNLKKLEESATVYGSVIPSSALGKYAVSNMCRSCGMYWHEWRKITDCCPTCKSTVLVRSIFTDIYKYKSKVSLIPKPNIEIMKWAKSLIGENCVGIFARGRKTYGRNLPPDFYVNLINLIQEMGYKVVWLGEKQSTIPCPVENILDFSRSEHSRDLEKTLAIICQLKFTIQFWTASTRLSGMMGVPFILFESPEQIYASYSGLQSAQEGKRLELTTFGKKKIVISHFKSVLENQSEGLNLVKKAIDEMNNDNWEDLIGLVEDEDFSRVLQKEFYDLLS
jgi:predicted Zn-ribbon and HTH transcriptional regulator